MWPREHIIREVAGSIAIAVQRGNAMTFLEGYDRAQAAALAQTAVSAKRKAREAEGGEVEIIGSAETTDEEEYLLSAPILRVTDTGREFVACR